MTRFQKKERDALDAYQREMNQFGLYVNKHSFCGSYNSDGTAFNLEARTNELPVKGNKALIEKAEAAGYIVWKWSRNEEKTGRRYFVFTVVKIMPIQLDELDAEEYLIHHDKEFLKACMEAIGTKCAEVGLKLSDKKTQIVKLTHGFTFLKVRVYITPTGHIVRKIHPSSVTRQRRKLKKLRQLLASEEMLPDDVYNSFQSWDSHAARFDTYRTRQTMRNLFAQLFPEIEERKRYEAYLEFERLRQMELEERLYMESWAPWAPAEEGGNST